MRQSRGILLIGLYVLLTSAVQIHAQPQYTVVDLGTFDARRVKDGGLVLGSQDRRPALWDQGQVMFLPDPGRGGVVTDMNVHGEMVGAVTTADGLTRPAYWYGGAFFEVPVSPGNHASAVGINDHSAVAGMGTFPDIPPVLFNKAWRRSASGQLEVLINPDGFNFEVTGLDNAGRVWGTLLHVGRTAQVYDVDGTVMNLAPEFDSWCSDVNRAGVAVGTVDDVGPAVAMQAELGRGRTLLPSLPAPFTDCFGFGINDNAHSVGLCSYHDGIQWVDHAVHWAGGTVTDLNSVIDYARGWLLAQAEDVSDDGHIVGQGSLNGEARTFLLMPQPAEPPALAIHLNQSNFTPGETLRVSLDLSNPGPLLTTDVYVGVILPNGVDTLFLTNLSPLEGSMTTLDNDPRTFARLLRNVSWPAGMRATQQDYFTHTFTGLEPRGTYHVLVGWTTPNSLEDGRIDDGDVLALAWAPFTFNPGATGLYAKMQAIRAWHLAQAGASLGSAE